MYIYISQPSIRIHIAKYPRYVELLLTASSSSFRNYPEEKLQENLDSEIMQVLLQEARDSYDEEIVVELTSNTSDEMEANIERIEAWIAQWRENNKGEVAK